MAEVAVAGADPGVISGSSEVAGDPAAENNSQVSAQSYNITSMRPPEHVADIGRDCSGLYHIFGNDMTRRNNLHFIGDETIVYASASAVVFQNTVSGTKDYLLSIDAGGIGCVAVHPSRQLFAVGGRGHQPNLYIYSYPKMEVVKVLRSGAEKGYACLNFSALGDKLASVSTAPDFMLTIWDWEEERMGLHSKAFGQDVFNVEFSEDDPGRLTTSGTGHIRFWKMASTFTGLKLQGSIGKFGKIDLSDIDSFVELPDGKVVSGTETGSLLLWEGNFIKCRLVRHGDRLCHDGVVEHLTFDRTEQTIMSAASDGFLRWWSFPTIDNAEVDSDHSMDFEIEPIAQLYLGEGVGVKAMVDSGSGRARRTLVILDTLGRLQSYAFVPHAANESGLLLLCESVKSLTKEMTDQLSNVRADSEYISDPHGKFVLDKIVFEKFHSGAITGMDTCPVDHLVATSSSDGSVRCVDYVNRRVVAYRKFDTVPTCLRWLPNSLDDSGILLAVGFADGIVRVLGLGDPENSDDAVESGGAGVGSASSGAKGVVTFLRKMVFKPHNAAVTDLSFSLSGSTFATAGMDGIIFFFSTKPIDSSSSPVAWKAVRFVTVDADSVESAAAATARGTTTAPTSCKTMSWSANGASLLAACTDGALREIDVRQLRPLMLQTNEDELITYEEFFPMRMVAVSVPMLAATKSGAGSTALLQSPSKASAATVTAADGAVVAANSVEATGAEAAAEGADDKEGASPSKQVAEVPVSMVAAKVSNAMYLIGQEGSYLTAAAVQQKNFLFQCAIGEEVPMKELPNGVYSTDGRDQMKTPLPTVFRYSWSKNFTVEGTSDGSVAVRPAAFLDTFVRMISQNGASRGVAAVAMSYDDRYVLSAGYDGTVVVRRLRLDCISERAERIFKDLDAGVFAGRLIKDAPKQQLSGDKPEVRYLTFVSPAAPSADDALFVSALAKRAANDSASILNEPMMNALDEKPDISSAAYSIQDNRLKLEEDAKRLAAEELKVRVRASIETLRKDYENIVQENEMIPEVARLTAEQMLVDKEYFDLLAQQGAEMVDEVHRECEHDAEKAATLLRKIKSRLMDGLLVEEFKLSAFQRATAAPAAKKAPPSVQSLRTKALDPYVQEIMLEVHAMVRAAELKDAQMRTTETAQRKANEAMDELMNRLHHKDDDNVAGGAVEDGREEPAPGAVAGIDTGAFGKSKSQAGETHNEFLVAESTIAARRQKRKERKEQLRKHGEDKPNEDEDDVRDLNAIKLAEKTIGDYKLKCADDYEVPEEQRINAQKKVRQMAMLEESMISMRLQFNDRFMALRNLKREIVFSIRRDNQRIREIDVDLQQPQQSQNLWQPLLDPDEFPDDADEITSGELKQFEEQRKQLPWEKVQPPKHVVITAEKIVIERNPRNGTYDATISSRDDLLAVGGPLENLLSDESLVDYTPPRSEPRRYYETDESLLSAFVRRPQSAEAQQLYALESKVPLLARMKASMKKRMVAKEKTPAQLVINAELRKQLEYERKMILQKMDENLSAFAEAVDDLRVDRHQITADLKLAELKLLVLFQEYHLLQTFESRDAALQQKQVRCQGELSEISSLTAENRTKLESKQEELQHWSEKLAQIQAEFRSMLPESHPYYETLCKIFRKKVKRSKGRDGDGDEEDEYDDDEEDEDDDDDEEEVEDICPPGCDQLLFERLLDLREKKLDTDEVSADISKGIEDLKKTIDRLKQREKQILKDAQQTELEVQQFQLQKQAALNQISVVVPLRIGQLYMFEESGSLTGPTDKAAAAAAAANAAASAKFGLATDSQDSQEDRGTVEKLRDPSTRMMCSHIDLNSHVLFSNKNLVRLKERITELHSEIDEAKEDFKHLHRQRGVLGKERESQMGDTEVWRARCRDLQMLKFGREIDLDELEASSDRSKEMEAEAQLKEDGEAFKRKAQKLLKEKMKLEDQLAAVTQRNTKLLNEVAELTNSRMQISKDLNAPGQVVTHNSKLDNFREAEEQKRIAAYVKFQATELESLRTELNMLKRKEAPPLLSSTQPPPAPSYAQKQQQQQQQQKLRQRTGDFTLPPLPTQPMQQR